MILIPYVQYIISAQHSDAEAGVVCAEGASDIIAGYGDTVQIEGRMYEVMGHHAEISQHEAAGFDQTPRLATVYIVHLRPYPSAPQAEDREPADMVS